MGLRSATAALIIAGLMVGCHVTGPTSIRTGRNDYNTAVQQTNNEQLLLNLVRLRYHDTPFFLETASIATTFTFETGLAASGNFPESAANPYGVSGHIAYTERPTITYAPLQGDQYVRELLSPLDLTTFLLFLHSGWEIDRLLRVVIHTINGIPNAPTAAGPTPAHAPEYERFLKVAELFRQLQIDGALRLGAPRDAQDGSVELLVVPGFRDDPRLRELVHELDLDPSAASYTLIRAVTGSPSEIAIVTRSLMAALFYLSHGVDVPNHDFEAGRIGVTHLESGDVFDWTSLCGDLLRVRASSSRPGGAYTTVHYRGTWFYIDDSDLSTKSTFSLLTQMLALQSGDIKTAAPVLTLPVNR